MKTDQHLRKHLKDYQPPNFGIRKTHLEFYLDADRTRVISSLQLHRITPDKNAALVLDGVELKLIELRLDGEILLTSDYRLTAETLVIDSVPDQFEISCEVEVDAAANTRLEGYSCPTEIFCTQCEAEGFAI